MADRKLSGSFTHPPHQNGGIGEATPKSSSSVLHNGNLEAATPSPVPLRTPSRPRGHSLGSWTRTTTSRRKKQEEPEALLDLILESQAQRLEDQRASLSLLPDPGPAAPCGACSPECPPTPSLDFYYMLIKYQSDRMDDQRCSLPVSADQEDFLSLLQRVQSRRMDEQRASMLLEDDQHMHASGLSGSTHRHPH